MLALPFLVLTACAPFDVWGQLDPSITNGQAGFYNGDADLKARGRLGPVPVAGERCDTPIAGTLDGSGRFAGTLSCSTDLLGDFELVVEGESIGQGLLVGTFAGTVAGEWLESGWEGGYSSAYDLFGVADGRNDIGAISVVWSGGFEASREPTPSSGQ